MTDRSNIDNLRIFDIKMKDLIYLKMFDLVFFLECTSVARVITLFFIFIILGKSRRKKRHLTSNRKYRKTRQIGRYLNKLCHLYSRSAFSKCPVSLNCRTNEVHSHSAPIKFFKYESRWPNLFHWIEMFGNMRDIPFDHIGKEYFNEIIFRLQSHTVCQKLHLYRNSMKDCTR